jgi:hypothetical protein
MSFGPPLWRPFALLACALIAAGLGFFVAELWAPAAVLLAAAVRDAISRPALVITPEGFQYVVGLGRNFAAWDHVEAVRVREERHFLAFGRNLEIDLSDETLVVLSQVQLAASPDRVAEVIEAGWRAGVAR